jgi:LysM repeat protein
MKGKWLPILMIVVLVVLLVGVLPASAAPHKSGVIHVVRRGETLYSIARRYGVSVWSIASVNGIANPNRIYAGQRLSIPTGQSTTGATSTTGTVHVVQRGETMLQIALRYGVDAWAIARANNVANMNYIYVGQRLVIPGTKPPAKPAAPQPAAPTTTWPGPWSGEYFDNVTLAGSAYTTRQDEHINFNWGSGPPAGGMPVNSFSVRWTGTFHFEEGVFRFYARVDDGVRVYVDGERIIDGWRDGGLRTYSADRSMLAGDHTVRVEYYDRTQIAQAYFWWKMVSGPAPTATPQPTATPGPTAVPGTSGQPQRGIWFGQFYNNEYLGGDPVFTHHVSWIDFDWGTESPVYEVWWDGFSARWISMVHLKTDHYRFCGMADDGFRIWVNQDLVLDKWTGNDGQAHCGSYWAQTGDYQVTVDYFEHGGEAWISMWWDAH